MQHQIRIIPTSTEIGYESLESLRLRTICHILLDYLSDEGLDEIRESLIEAINFYHEPKTFSEPFEIGEGFEVTLGEGYERPIFQIAED
jgi:hypothetical protein